MTAPINVLLVEDEPHALDRLRRFVKMDSDVHIAGECKDGDSAVESIRRLKPDVVFLDIQIPEKDGFQVVAEIGPGDMPIVVFVTAYDEYAVKAFEICALDYILKPFEASRVARALERAKQLMAAGSPKELEHRFFELLKTRQAPYLKRILLKSSGRLTFLNVDEIDWIKADGNYVELHAGGAVSLLRGTLNETEAQLDPDKFLRVHRSVMVRIDAIREIQQSFGRSFTLVMKDGARLPLSRRYARKLPAIADSLK